MTADSAHTYQALSDLRLHWDEASEITYHPGEAEPCHAGRLDDGTFLTASTPWLLREKIIHDYTARPVPRTDTVPERTARPGADPLSWADAGDRLHAC